MPNPKATILLLRDPDEEYHRASVARDLLPLFIQVLADKAENKSELNARIANINDTSIWGVVSTSKRASFAFKAALQTLTEDSRTDCIQITEYWKNKVYFAPGKASARPFLDISLQVQGYETTSDASTLAKFIIQYIEELPAEEKKKIQSKKLLFLTGDKTRDELGSALSAASIPVEQLQVYSTYPNPNLTAMLEVAQNNIINKFDWVVFFSPSGVDLALPMLSSSPNWINTKVAAIGNTTKSHLESHSIHVHAVPLKPTAEQLFVAISTIQ
ncbi:uroporphyrinogen-III synthase [Entomophthora muscae]|uniref:Uroporphyrinogen-III synthase n=1 Tax=Entomophthora muscae TaxID=34485 RepID=A0ACC2TMR2_9FUNG|nr:uroporphyrinogen-III synthase [Entomophthora muscae]